ncbi:MAG TPA: phage holin family protein [Acidimicrobiales bacterium]|nr:phage holin family protein [Acidimicrobiales bacterium]
MASQWLGYPRSEERSTGELLSELSGEVKNLLRSEVELAKLEAKEQMGKATRAGAMFGGMAVAGLFGGLLVSFALAWTAAEVIPTGLAFLAVGLLYLVVAGLLFVQGRKRLADINPVPHQTLRTVKGDVQAAKQALSRAAASDPWDRRR